MTSTTQGIVVGNFRDPITTVPVVWTVIPAVWIGGVFYSLNDLIKEDDPLRTWIQQALAINNRGQILAEGYGRVFLLTPSGRR